ncbi:hypothetical protein PIROE2DRAFT_65719 [Piromyces sp. E2]|nr:hypothetical protein PIROE2DRAFT_65719 [Piromyces sp. E2]|eukprot:OUM56113.1 hypothetical protein PIROE2DRAFT_65719 [Piromyces sp. E2]
MDVQKLLRDLPMLINYGNDIDAWLNKFQTIMEKWNINKPERKFVFIKQCVEDDIRMIIDKLKSKNEIESYPTMDEIKTAIEDYLDITPNDKCWKLKSFQLQIDKPLKLFNIEYLRKYYDIKEEYRILITVDDYINSIKTRIYPCLLILEKECKSIEEAIKCSEKADKIERILNLNQIFTQQFELNKINNFNNQDLTNNNCKLRKPNDKKIMCFKCYELGHKVEKCPYSYRELVHMEEKGILAENRMKNFDPNFKHRNKQIKLNGNKHNDSFVKTKKMFYTNNKTWHYKSFNSYRCPKFNWNNKFKNNNYYPIKCTNNRMNFEYVKDDNFRDYNTNNYKNDKENINYKNSNNIYINKRRYVIKNDVESKPESHKDVVMNQSSQEMTPNLIKSNSQTTLVAVDNDINNDNLIENKEIKKDDTEICKCKNGNLLQNEIYMPNNIELQQINQGLQIDTENDINNNVKITKDNYKYKKKNRKNY